MKKYVILMSLFLIVHSIVYSQVPDQLNYQAAIRNNDGDLIVNQSVKVRVSIINEAMDGNELYIELHNVTTNSFGLVNFIIGNGTAESGSFAEINWGEKKKFLGISIDVGTGYVPMGTVQLLAVPYALYANDVANKDDADADATNEIQNISLTGTDLSISNSNTIDVSSLIDDADNDPLNELQNLVLNVDTLEISNGNKITLPYDSSLWVVSGNNLSYSTGNVGIGSINPESNFEVKSNTFGTDALFQVINANNDTVFAVYPDGVKVFVDPAAKGKVGGFAVSGRSPSKAGGEVEYMRVTADSTRIYVSDTVTAKGKVGGFAVSGRSPSKGTNVEILFVNADSTRVYVNDDPNAKGKVGGFAVSGRSPSKGTVSSLMDLTKDNYFIGHQSGSSNTTGLYNSFIGYEAGLLNTEGNRGVFIGYKAGSMNTLGNNNTFIGNNAGFQNTEGYRNVFIGDSAGLNNTTSGLNVFVGANAGKANTEGSLNTFLGEEAGLSNTTGLRNVFLGTYAGASNTEGILNIFIGALAGAFSTTGDRNIFIGQAAGWSNDTASYNIFIGDKSGLANTKGEYNVFMGYLSGYNNRTASYNVFIGENSAYQNRTGEYNTFLGSKTGYNHLYGNSNVYIGEQAGYSSTNADENTYLGYRSGWNSSGSHNVFIGSYAGYNEAGSDKLYISNSDTESPLIYGEFENRLVQVNGSIKLTDILNLGPKTSYPGSPTEGDIFYDKNTHSIKFFNGTEWMELSATASASPPLVTTVSIPDLSIQAFSCVVNGNISDQGGSAIVQSGVCYSSVPFFDIELADTVNYSSPGIGDFGVEITGLDDSQDYYVRAFATNSSGTSIGNMMSFTTRSLPSVITNEVLDIAQTTATAGGEVTSPDVSELTAYGICWSTTPAPTIEDDFSSETLVSETFVYNFTGLTEETTYYVRAYATNAYGTAYGNEVSFTTASYLPVVETNGVFGITQTTAIGGGNIDMPGGIAITAMGICWSTAPSPTIANDFTAESIALGTFTSNITGLIAETTYYVRAYATNAYGTVYGDEVIFNAASDITTVSDIEGNIYNTVQIGTQTWMQENLKTTKYNDGSDIPNITDNTEWVAQTDGAYCWYDNDAVTNKDTYGALYNYYTVEDSRNLCPTGWHVPTDTEWTNLSDYLGGNSIAGGKLKEAGTVHWISPNTGADNSSGFTALPGGFRYIGTFSYIERGSTWLMDTGTNANYIDIYYNSSDLSIYPDTKDNAGYVRCLKD